ncbi:M48 family metallopeptidase [Hydrogenimonas sp.]
MKNITLKITPDGKVRLAAPLHILASEALGFLQKKESWVQKKILQRKTYARSNPQKVNDGASIWYLGKPYPLKLKPAARNHISFEGDEFHFHFSDINAFERAIERFYKRAAQKFISQRVAQWSEKMGLYPNEIGYRRYKSRWGCCKADNSLVFNTALMRYDARLVDYVVIHELAHIRHKHHRPSFWRLVERFEPEWKTLRKRLL